jgi:hypothetical protein
MQLFGERRLKKQKRDIQNNFFSVFVVGNACEFPAKSFFDVRFLPLRICSHLIQLFLTVDHVPVKI